MPASPLLSEGLERAKIAAEGAWGCVHPTRPTYLHITVYNLRLVVNIDIQIIQTFGFVYHYRSLSDSVQFRQDDAKASRPPYRKPRTLLQGMEGI
jgi:hypothetical protein